MSSFKDFEVQVTYEQSGSVSVRAVNQEDAFNKVVEMMERGDSMDIEVDDGGGSVTSVNGVTFEDPVDGTFYEWEAIEEVDVVLERSS